MMINSLAFKLKNIYSKIFPDSMIICPPSSGGSALTFDDGPCRNNSEKLLKIHDEFNIKSTFFFSGELAYKNKDLVKEVFDEGHQIANHGYYHVSARELGVGNYLSGVIRTHQILSEVTGREIGKLFRPPYGELNIHAHFSLVSKGYRYVMWSYDTNDSYLKTADEIIKHIKSNPPRDNEIFLMHEDYTHLVKALPELIEYLQVSSHKLSTIEQLK